MYVHVIMNTSNIANTSCTNTGETTCTCNNENTYTKKNSVQAVISFVNCQNNKEIKCNTSYEASIPYLEGLFFIQSVP